MLLFIFARIASASEAIWTEGEDPTVSSGFNQHNWYSNVDETLLSPGLPGSASGSWAAHYANNSTPVDATWSFTVTEGGPYTIWARVGTYRVSMWASVDGGEAVDLDLDNRARETINLVDPTLDIRFLSWVEVGSFDLDPGPHTITFGLEPHPDWAGVSIYGGVDAFVATNLDRWMPTGAVQPELEPTEGAPDEWFPFLPMAEPVEGTSALDASGLVERPAGARGAVRREGDAFVLGDGTPIKLWGVNVGEVPLTEELQEAQARFWARHGINAVRLHSVGAWLGYTRDASGNPVFDEARLDALDRWFAVLAEHGIYSCWSLFYPYELAETDDYPADLRAELPSSTYGRSTSGFATFRPELQDAESGWAEALLAHRNPYTGNTYAEDPALAMIELRNEDSVFWHAPLNTLWDGSYPAHLADLQADWATWLAERYADDDALLAAWGPTWGGSKPGDSLSNPAMEIYAAWDMAADGPLTNAAETARMGDFIRFLAETQREGYERRADALRDAGFGGVIVSTGWLAGGDAAHLANVWTDAALDAVDRHNYVGGGVGSWRVTTGEVYPYTHFDDPGGGLLSVVSSQVEDKPFTMTEWDSVTPNPYKLEAAPLQAFYGMGLQGWDGLFHFAASGWSYEGGWPRHYSYVSETPHYLGQYPALSYAVHQGHVSQGDVSAAVRVSVDEISRGVDARVHPSEGAGFAGADSLDVPAAAALLGRVSVAFEDGGVSEAADWGDLTGEVASLGGELRWDVANRYAQVRSAHTQGVIGFGGGVTHALPAAEIALRTEYAVVLITPLDGQPLAESTRVLVTAMARDIETGARYNADDTQLEAYGGPPLLLEPVQADITLPGPAIEAVTALEVDGLPRMDVPFTGDTFTIDGRWRSCWYLVERAGADDTGTDDTGPAGDDTGHPGDDTGTGKGEGCGCDSTGVAPWVGALAAGFVVRRRRRG
jgi:hypothetical protein